MTRFPKRPKTSGVYAIRNTRTEFLYVGSSRRIEDRWAGHISQLQHGRHSNHALQEAWNHDGPAAFQMVVIEITRDHGAYLLEAERRTLNALRRAGVPLYSSVSVGRGDWHMAHDEGRAIWGRSPQQIIAEEVYGCNPMSADEFDTRWQPTDLMAARED